MKIPEVIAFSLIFFFASLVVQSRILQDNYEYELKAKTTSIIMRIELPTSSLSLDSPSSLERFNSIVKLMTTLMSSLTSKELGGKEALPPPSPKPSDPEHQTIIESSSSFEEFGRGPTLRAPPSPKPSQSQNPTIIESSNLSSREFGREPAKPAPPSPKPYNPEHPTAVIASGYERKGRLPPPAPKPGTPVHPGNNGGEQVISMETNPNFMASA